MILDWLNFIPGTGKLFMIIASLIGTYTNF